MIEKVLGGGVFDLSMATRCCCGCDCSGRSSDYGHGYHAGIGDGGIAKK